jgi:predicted MFS family arabinose efflux permease
MDAAARLAATRWALLLGNFAIGCGVMVVPGALNDITHSLGVSVAVGGQLIAIAAAVMCLGAPLLAGLVSSVDRRLLLAIALLWYAVGHGLSALMPDYPALAVLRAITVLGAAVFTPQAAAAIGVMAPAAQRGQAITFIFLGWSLASVLGMPVHSLIAGTLGWRWAFWLVAALSLGSAAWLWLVMPKGVRPPALSLRSWGQVFSQPMLCGALLVTVLSAAGQFTLFSYFAPYYKLRFGAGALQISLLFCWFGAMGVLGNVVLSRVIDRTGAGLSVTALLGLIVLSLLAWPLGVGLASMALVLAPWALACFSSNSGQQVRLSIAAPALAGALMALNSSAMYLGQAAGAAGGGWLVAHEGFGRLHLVSLGWLLAAVALSFWVYRAEQRARRKAVQAAVPT